MKRDKRTQPASEDETLLPEPAASPGPLTPPEPAPPAQARGGGILKRTWGDIRQTVKEAGQWRVLRKTPFGLLPIVLLSAEGIVRGFDSSIFILVLPNIVRDLEIDAPKLLTAVNLAGFFLIFATLGISYLLDRMPRVPFFAGGTFLGGLFSYLTAGMSSSWTIGLSRVGDAVTDTAASTPRLSLTSDYYPVEHRGKAFALVGALQRGGRLAAPVAIAALAAATSWRVPYLVTGSLLLVVGVLGFVLLREPVRGYMERKALGSDEKVAEQPEPPPSFGEAWRTIWGVRTLRRLFIGSVSEGIGSRIYALTISIYLAEQFDFDIMGRGWLFFVGGLFALPASFMAGGIVDTLTRRRPQRVLVFSGVVAIIAGLGIAAIASSPPVFLLYVVFAIFGASFALLGPARSVFFAQILPAHVRTMGIGVLVLADIPAVVISQVFLNQIPNWGIGGVVMAAAPFWIINGLIDISASSLFERDMRSAMASQLATQEHRRTKETGREKLLVCRDVDVEYDGVQVLFGVDFDLVDGDILALLGTNGAGKSTLLRAISGVQEASGGAIVFDGRDITHVPPHEIAARGVVHMPGGRGVFPGLTVKENMVLGRWTRATNQAVLAEEDGQVEATPDVEPDREFEDVLDIFPALRPHLNKRAGTLSGGEQQMVALAMAFLQRPRLLMIDELSLGLAPAVVEELLESVRRIHESGVTVVIVEQSVNVALTIADRAIFMEKGEVRFIGGTRDLLSRPDILRAVYVKGTGALTGGPVGGKKTTDRAHELEAAQVVLSVEGLSKSFGGVRAVNDVTFNLKESEILGLIGPNGAGKTTIFDLVSGYLKPDAGRIVYEGADVGRLGPDARSRLQLIRRFQDARLFPSLTVYETLLVALERHNDVKNMFVTALQLPQVRSSERRVRRRADRLIELLDLEAFRDKFVKELSTGLRRITDLACVLATDPKVLLLDEPSSGIAQAETESLAPLLRRVRFETGCSILIIEHDMPLISSVSDDLLALDQGSVVMRGTPDEVLNDSRVIEAYLGTSEQVIKRSGVTT